MRSVGTHSGSRLSSWTDVVAISSSWQHTVGLKSDGTVVAVGRNRSGQCEVSGWTGIVAIAAGSDHTLGLKADGTIVFVGDSSYGEDDATGWNDIVAIAGLNNPLGIRKDGTVVTAGWQASRFPKWNSIIAVDSFRSYATIGLKANGTVVCYDTDKAVTGWSDIVAIAIGDFAIGLKQDGTVVSTAFVPGLSDLKLFE